MTDVDMQSGRSSSFRRMLELERAYMIERLQANRPAQQQSLAPDSARPAFPPRRSTEGSSLQHRRARTTSPERPGSRRRGTSSPPGKESTLVIDTSSPAMPDLGKRLQHQQNQQQQNQQQQNQQQQNQQRPLPSSALGSAPIKMAPTVVARPVSPTPSLPKDDDEKSICVSPSWEAHGRRRKEKKMEKREKEEAAKTALAKSKKSRLSKPPPPASSMEALKRAEGAVPDPRGRLQDRPVSGAAKGQKESAPRKSRSRSSSFASLIRSPLSFRRQSVDRAVEPEFVGGIKLELQRQYANDRALNQQAKADGADTHPALRGEQGQLQTSEPLKSPPPPPTRGSDEAKSPVKRSYPPITRLEKHPRKRALVSPTAPAVPDLNKIDRWRARVGLKPSSQPTSPTSPAPETQPAYVEDVSRYVELPPHEATAGANVTGPLLPDGEVAAQPVVDSDRVTAQERPLDQAHHIAFEGIPPALGDRGGAKDGQDVSINGSIRPNSRGGASGYRTAPSTPPDPPRRSPRRSSLLQAEDGVPVPPADWAEPPPRLSLNLESPPPDARNHKVEDVKPAAAEKTAGKALTLDVARETVRLNLSPVLRSAEAKSQKSPSQMSWTNRTRSLPVSSPDESCSDENQSTPSTPATPRSDSEKGPLTPGLGAKGGLPEPQVNRASRDDARPLTRGHQLADDKGNHEYKEQVLASRNEATSTARHGDHGPEMVANRSLVPVPMRQAPVTTDKNAPGRSSRLSMAPAHHARGASGPRMTMARPEPASYLEEARRMPMAPSSRGGGKPRLGPPATFALPGDMASPPTTRSHGSRPSDGGQFAAHMSTSGPSPREREPIAKMFVECCHCKFYHDMPSNLYEAMANPGSALSGRDTMGYAGAISMTVKCPWCRHEMSTKCCAGLAAMVYVTERLH